MTTPDPSKPAPSTVAWNKVQQYLDKLFDACESLEEAGGIRAAADSAGWTPKARKRAEAALADAREAIERQLGQLKGKGPGR